MIQTDLMRGIYIKPEHLDASIAHDVCRLVIVLMRHLNTEGFLALQFKCKCEKYISWNL